MSQPRQPVSLLEKDLSVEQLDAGKRSSDLLNLMLTHHGFDTVRDKCMAIRLSDGSSDGVLYDNKTDAIRHQLHEQQCYYVFFRNLPGGAKPLEMAIMLEFQRRAYSAGLRLVDPGHPTGGREVLLTTNWYDSIKATIKRRGVRT